eukprot:scaffold161544_cov35-Tisochrysis_lutea.AAC.5
MFNERGSQPVAHHLTGISNEGGWQGNVILLVDMGFPAGEALQASEGMMRWGAVGDPDHGMRGSYFD